MDGECCRKPVPDWESRPPRPWSAGNWKRARRSVLVGPSYGDRSASPTEKSAECSSFALDQVYLFRKNLPAYMRLGSIVRRYLRSSLALSVVAIAFWASFASRHWPEPILRSPLQRYLPYSSCASCDADQLLLHIVASALITLSYLVISTAFVYLFVLC